MPPANSPTDTPTRPTSTVPLDQPIPTLIENAALNEEQYSLTGRAEAQVNEDNISFLRTTASMSEAEDDDTPYLQAARRLRQMDNLIIEQRRIQSERESARRLRRAVLRSGINTVSPLSGPSNAGTQSPSSESRDTLRRPPGYQGWAPGTLDEELEEAHLTLNELRALARGHTRPAQDTATRRHQREEGPGLPSMTSSRRSAADSDQMDWHSSRPANAPTSDQTFSESSLRTTALLQSVRRHARFNSPRSWLLNGGSSERERTLPSITLERQERDGRNLATRRTQPSIAQRRDPLDDLRRGISYDLHRARNRDDQSPQALHHMEEAIKYLERLRYCGSYSESLSFAEAGGFVDGDAFPYSRDRDDFIIDTATIPPPQKSSWLRVGAVLSGSQRSHSCNILPSFNLSTPSRRSQTSSASSGQPTSITTPLARSWIPNLSLTGDNPGEDTWPVNVTIDSISYDTMTLTGTMEARNVPTKNVPNKESTIATYLEGEIIDLNRFTLETKSFSADPKIDSTYWRELEPFKSLSDEELVQSVVSRKWLSEELGGKYILMRWKEKCFITPSDAQVHLTISGFYYVSLRRRDGHVEGLYFDPNSSPYQHLSLQPANRDFPSYQFR